MFATVSPLAVETLIKIWDTQTAERKNKKIMWGVVPPFLDFNFEDYLYLERNGKKNQVVEVW